MNPEMIAFHGSSFCLYPLTAQSNVEKSPPQTPKFPPRTGARALIAEREPRRRSPWNGATGGKSRRRTMTRKCGAQQCERRAMGFVEHPDGEEIHGPLGYSERP